MAYDCLDIVSVRNPCIDQSDIIFFLDETGISLAKSAKQADERYVTGFELVTAKIKYAKDDVLEHLTHNIANPPNCDLDTPDGIICVNATIIARAIMYRAAGLIYKDLILDSTRYNEYVAYGKDSAMVNAVLYDSTWGLLAKMSGLDDVPRQGMYQEQLQRLEPIRRDIEMVCCTDCTGSRWQIVIP